MAIKQTGQNCVVIAHSMNPSIFSALWLTKNNIVEEAQIHDGAIFAPQVAQLATDEFRLVVLSDRLQFMPSGDATAEQRDLVRCVVGRIVELLPHTPYLAAGLNFFWEIRHDNFAEYNQRMFGCSNAATRQNFTHESSRYGSYSSRDALGVRLKLDVKPQHNPEDRVDEYMALYFNFHTELTADPVGQINRLIDIWPDAFLLSRQITESLDG